MEQSTLAQLEMVQQLLLLITAFTTSRLMQLDVVLTRPDGICDVLVHHRDIPLMSDDFRHTSIFNHQGIVSAVFRDFPEPHFLVSGFLEAIHNSLEAFYLVQVHARLGQAVQRFIRLASSTPGPYPACYEDVRRRTFVPTRPVRPMTSHVCSPVTASTAQFRPIQRPPAPIRPRPSPTMETLQQTVNKVDELLRIRQERRQANTVRPTPVRAPVPSTGSPTPTENTPPSRLQRHFSSTPEPAAYSVQNPFCTECDSFHPPLNTNDFGPTDDQLIEAARQQGVQELRIQADQFVTDLLQSHEPPVRRRRVVPAARRASPLLPTPLPPPTLLPTPPSPSRQVRSPSYHSSLEPSPEPQAQPVQHETPGLSPAASSPASPTPSFTDRMVYLTVHLRNQERIVVRHHDSSDDSDEG
jgi:hypothetical protein